LIVMEFVLWLTVKPFAPSSPAAPEAPTGP
jgi:hypothetical protein